MSRGKFRLDFEPVNVAHIAEESLSKVGHFMNERDLQLTVSLSNENIILWGDPLRLQQVITNLLRNAARCTPRGGKIDFSSRRNRAAL